MSAVPLENDANWMRILQYKSTLCSAGPRNERAERHQNVVQLSLLLRLIKHTDLQGTTSTEYKIHSFSELILRYLIKASTSARKAIANFIVVLHVVQVHLSRHTRYSSYCLRPRIRFIISFPAIRIFQSLISLLDQNK